MIRPLAQIAKCTRETSLSHSNAIVLHKSGTERYDRTFVPRVSRA
nr:unnamed protein product [Callosobruchus chinensis]